jgi:hypothetical protein
MRMPVAELLGSFSPEMQIIVGGLMLLGFVLGGVLLSGLGIKKREAAHDAKELRALLDRAVSVLEERKGRDRKAVLSLRHKPVRRLVIRKNSAVRNAVRWSEGRAFGPRR